MSAYEKDGEDNNVAGVPTSMCPEGSVPLHDLCERCRELFDNWSLLDRGVTGLVLKNSHERKIGTPVQLSRSQEFCHFCAMVFSRIKDDKDLDPNKSLTLDVHSMDIKHMCFLLSIGNGEDLRDIGLYLTWYKYSNADGFESPENKSRVPRQAAANLDQINMWLNACRSNHKVCSNWCPSLKSQGKRPARVLEVLPESVRLRCDVHDEEFEYLTLSHMWGKDPLQQLRLSMSRLHEFEKAIPWEELPILFKEAIRITRHMGFKYLWIDSLCIIQDSGPDWEAQAATMATVYCNAVCNISFLSPPGENLIQSREDPRTMSPCVIRKATPVKRGISITPSSGYITNWVAPPPGYLSTTRHHPPIRQWSASRLYQHDWPTSSRAWTFQEHLLSPRTVLYGYQTIMWECAETFSDELGGTWLPNNEAFHELMSSHQRPIRKRLLSRGNCGSLRSAVRRRSSSPVDEPTHDYLSNWIELVHGYRSRHLTVSQDRPMAFAGVAQAFQAEHGLTYLAGLWAECLPSCLLWFTKHYDTRQYAKDSDEEDGSSLASDQEDCIPVDAWPKEPVPNSIPSWSWFSSPIFAEGYRHPRGDSLEYPWHAYLGFRDILLYSARLTHFQWPGLSINHIPPRALHDFSGLRISLQVATFTTSITKFADDTWAECTSLLDQLRLFKGVESAGAAYYCDDPKELEQPPTTVVLALVMEISAQFPWESQSLRGLVLRPAKKQGTWKRVGFWRSGISWDKEYLDSLTSETGVAGDSAGTLTTRKGSPKTDVGSGSTDSDAFQPSKESMFMRLKGVEVETITLV